MKVMDLIDVLVRDVVDVKGDMDVRIGDVAEGSDLHCSVGRVEKRGEVIVIVPGDDDVWKDETLSSEVLSRRLWPPLPVKEEKE